MTKPLTVFPLAACLVMLFAFQSFAQNAERRSSDSTTQPQEQSPTMPQNATSLDIVANEMGLLRRSVQTLNTRLREISEKALAPDSKESNSANDKQKSIAANLNLLSLAEQRAEGLRKGLLEMIEKETSLRGRLAQIDEDMRPENIERAMNLAGSTRVAEMRDARRRTLENERRGVETLLNQVTQSRIRLEDDVRQADSLVSRLRQRVLPLIDKEIEKINPN